MQSIMLISVLAALASAIPTTTTTTEARAATSSAAPHFSCLQAFSICLHTEGYNGNNSGYAAIDCSAKMTDCGKCAKQESQCFANAFKPNTTNSVDCVGQSAVCYQTTWNRGTTVGAYYDCGSAVAECELQPFANNAYCSSVASRCKTCQDQEHACRTAKDANMTYCSASADNCFAKAVGAEK